LFEIRGKIRFRDGSEESCTLYVLWKLDPPVSSAPNRERTNIPRSKTAGYETRVRIDVDTW
jgi:hypothetical protein